MITLTKVKFLKDHKCYKKEFIINFNNKNIIVGNYGSGKTTLLNAIKDLFESNNDNLIATLLIDKQILVNLLNFQIFIELQSFLHNNRIGIKYFYDKNIFEDIKKHEIEINSIINNNIWITNFILKYVFELNENDNKLSIKQTQDCIYYLQNNKKIFHFDEITKILDKKLNKYYYSKDHIFIHQVIKACIYWQSSYIDIDLIHEHYNNIVYKSDIKNFLNDDQNKIYNKYQKTDTNNNISSFNGLSYTFIANRLLKYINDRIIYVNNDFVDYNLLNKYRSQICNSKYTDEKYVFNESQLYDIDNYNKNKKLLLKKDKIYDNVKQIYHEITNKELIFIDNEIKEIQKYNKNFKFKNTQFDKNIPRTEYINFLNKICITYNINLQNQVNFNLQNILKYKENSNNVSLYNIVNNINCELSRGEKKLVNMLIIINNVFEKNDGCILIDEPLEFMGDNIINPFYNFLIEKIKNYDKQVIIATHNKAFINLHLSENIMRCINNNNETLIKYINIKYTKNDNKQNKVLDLINDHKELFFSDKCLFVEGKHDHKIINRLIKCSNNDKLKSHMIINIRSASNFSLIYELCEKIGVSKIKFLLDFDQIHNIALNDKTNTIKINEISDICLEIKKLQNIFQKNGKYNEQRYLDFLKQLGNNNYIYVWSFLTFDIEAFMPKKCNFDKEKWVQLTYNDIDKYIENILKINKNINSNDLSVMINNFYMIINKYKNIKKRKKEKIIKDIRKYYKRKYDIYKMILNNELKNFNLFLEK